MLGIPLQRNSTYDYNICVVLLKQQDKFLDFYHMDWMHM
jgi:hypothetical protein